MLDWDDLRHYLAVHRHGTLAKAGAALGINATTVGRRLTALEDRVQARLFDRTPDGYVLTSAGLELLPRAERIEEETLAIERDVLGADRRFSGTVRVTATEMLATRFIAPRLPDFRTRYPDIVLALECTNRTVSLSRREADIALRLARPREENVVTRPLTNIPLALYASTEYAARRPLPPDPEESIAGHDVILFADTRAFTYENDWFVPKLGGAKVALRSDSVSSIYSATLAGVGIALLPVAVAERDPGLCHIPTRTSPEPRVIWQAVYEDVQKSARVRVVLDYIAEILATTETLPGTR